MRYIGRFAPSPTGALHSGSLIAATASYLDAKSTSGRWLVRMEDVDLTRARAGAAEDILRTLERLGFAWDGEVMFQSSRGDAYREAFEAMRRDGYIYACGCSRKEIGDSGPATEPRYAGTCRAGLASGRAARSWRVRASGERIGFMDRVQGWQQQSVEEYCGDFVVLRADGMFAYQLAVVVDDRDQGVTDIVRGADLLASTPRQIYLQRLLGAKTPRYLHVPVAVNAEGQKLSKQTMAPGLSNDSEAIHSALRFLGQAPPEDALGASADDLWRWAIEHWRPERIPAVLTAQV